MSEEQERDVLLTVEGGIGYVTLNAEKRLNALNTTLLDQLEEAVSEIEKSDEIKVVILSGKGRAFAAGADIKGMLEMDPKEGVTYAAKTMRTFRRLELLPQPVIALVQGFALGGGNELAMSADIRIVAEGTKMGQPEVTLGITPGFGGTQRLPRLVGQGRALYLCFTGEMISAEEAYRIGLANEVVPADQLEARGKEIAEKLLSLAPYAIAQIKNAIYRAQDTDLEAGLAYEAAVFGLTFGTEDKAEGMGAFAEKRKASFTGK